MSKCYFNALLVNYVLFSPGASLDFYIAFGSLALMVSTLVRGADPEWGTLSQLDSLCAVSNNVHLVNSCSYLIVLS